MTLRKKINLSLIIFTLLFIFSIIFLISPLYKDIKNNSQELISKKQEMAVLEAKIKNIEEFKKNYREINPNLEKIATLFVESAVPIEFIDFLEKTSRDCQTSIKISPSLVVKIPKDPWPSIAFQITSVGSFPNFLKFLEKLESSKYLIEIQNLNISRLTEAELKLKEFEKFSLGDVKTIFSLKVYTK